MGNNDNKGNVVELGGQQFTVVKKGLDEAEVTSFINQLIDERDQLLDQKKHFDSLTKLAERTIVESDRLATEIKKEATEKAKAEADEIVAKAEEQTQKMLEEKRTEIVNVATEEAEAIKADVKKEVEAIKADAEKEAKAIKASAEKQATLLVEDEKQKIQFALSDMVHQIYSDLIVQLDSFKLQAVTSKEEFEQKLPGFFKDISLESTLSESVAQQETIVVPAVDAEEPGEEAEVSAELESQAIEQTEAIEVEEETPARVDNEDTAMYEGEVELEILPPINIMQIIAVMQYLDSLSEIEATELIPLYDRPSIIASLRRPLPLLDVLQGLPEVAEVREDLEEEVVASGDHTSIDRKRRKIKIRLIEDKSVLEETKERPNNEVSDVLSKQSDSGKK